LLNIVDAVDEEWAEENWNNLKKYKLKKYRE
jgi:hypothetical protein